jgi:hypothetical protein
MNAAVGMALHTAEISRLEIANLRFHIISNVKYEI